MIIGVAIKHDGKTYRLPKPNRHVDVMRKIWDEIGMVNILGGSNQGFYIDDENETFLDRQEAMLYTKKHNQINKGLFQKNTLFSEDLW